MIKNSHILWYMTIFYYLCIIKTILKHSTMKLDLETLKWVLEQSTNINKWDLRQILYEEIEKIENDDLEVTDKN